MKRTSIMMASFAGIMACALLPGTAMAAGDAAQDAPADAPAKAQDAPAQDGNAIVVTGLRASLRDALQAKRINTLVVDTISSKDIGALPDITIADELNRLPGVNASRDRGNDSQASVRGLGPRLVLGLVNGREVATSEPDRNVRWEIYPSEDVSAVTVYKSQDASLIDGGVAATIDIRTLRPLDYVGSPLTVRAGAQYNDGGKDIPGYSRWGTRGSLQYVAKLTDTFALAAGGSYQQQRNGKVSFQGWGYNEANTNGDSAPVYNGSPVNAPYGAQTEVDATTETRWSATGAMQWKPDADWDINADILYSDVKIAEPQFQQWYGNANGWGDYGGTIGAPGDIYQPGHFTIAGNSIVAATLNNYSSVTNVIDDYSEDKHLLTAGLNVKYSHDDTTIKFDGSYSQAARTNAYYAAQSQVYPQTVSFNTAAGVLPSVIESGDPALPASQNFTMTGDTGPQRLVDSLGAFQFDVYHRLHDSLFTGIGVGVRMAGRTKTFTSGFATVSINPGTPTLSEFGVNNTGITVPNLVYGNFNQLVAISNTTDSGDNSQYWRVSENTYEGYAKADFAGQAGAVPFAGNIGVRLVDVVTGSSAFQGTTTYDSTIGANVTSYQPTYFTNHYFRALPSLNVNFTLSPDVILRAGVAEVMSRPPLDELRASTNLSYYPPSYLQGSAGNPLLRPFMATQGDLSAEWYFHKDALLAVAGYYKQIGTNVGYAVFPETIAGTNYTITGPANGPGGHIAGSEVTFQTQFYFVPALRQFGIYANVALVTSNLKELAPVSNPFAAVGLAAFTSESDLWYSGHGIDARVGLKHHSPYTAIFGWNAAQLTRLESETTLGASVSYALTRSISVRFQANNLLNKASRYYFNNDPNQIARYEKYGVNYLADVTFKY